MYSDYAQLCRSIVIRVKRLLALLLVNDHDRSFLQHPADGVFDGNGALLSNATDPIDPDNIRPGSVIGTYKLLEEIGEGGFGKVFMAEQLLPIRRTVALKIIKLGMNTSQVIARFESERQALALMSHPNIAQIIDAGTTGEVQGQSTLSGGRSSVS